MSLQVAPAWVLAHLAPEFLDSLTVRERLVLAHMPDVWLRPEQRIPRGPFRTLGFSGARGWGKTYAVASEINRGVEAGDYRSIALLGPNDERVDEVMVHSLIDMAPPWFRPERYRGNLRWPNGVIAEAFTAEQPDGPRGGNFDLSWLCEIVGWQHTTRDEAFSNVFLATRVGCAKLLYDTTSRGQNSVILALRKMHEQDPAQHLYRSGTTFDNPLLPRGYLRSVCASYPKDSRRYREEIMGEVFTESAGALWEQKWLDENRRAIAPSDPVLVLVAVDPAISTREGADPTGMIKGSLGRDGHCYVTSDDSGRMGPSQWVQKAIDHCAHDASGLVVERNRGAQVNTDLIRAHAGPRGFEVTILEKDAPFPRRVPGRIFIREMWAASSKHSRGEGPADLGRAGRVHHVGAFPELEYELTSWEPGVGLSPNRLDAHAYLIGELSGITRPAAVDASGDVRAAAAAREYMRNLGATERSGLRLSIRSSNRSA